MADSGIKKVTISKEKLGTVVGTNEYVVRYRVVSEDKNRSSHWSPNYLVLSTPIETVLGNVSISKESVSVTWQNPRQRPEFDVFVGFNNVAPTWHGSSITNTYQFIKTGTLPVRVVVQIKSTGNLKDSLFYKDLNIDLVLYDSGQVLV
jgi:hypothetical protein